jgi:hypothetical protein
VVVRLGRSKFPLLTGGAQLLLFLVALRIHERPGWLAILPLIAAISFWAWTANFRRYRVVGDTPTSDVASAAQGYVELLGRAENHTGIQVIAALSKRVCCWYQYQLERRSGDNDWHTEDAGESVETFVLRDATGACTVDPEGAEVIAAHKETWTQGDYRSTEWWIAPGDPLYALGEFRTHTAAPTAGDRHADVGALLAAWKNDKPELLRRFDLDSDGAIDFKEWRLARAAAQRHVDQAHAALRDAPPHDCVARPTDGRPYLLANMTPQRIVRRYVVWAWVNIAAFAGAIGGLIVALAA